MITKDKLPKLPFGEGSFDIAKNGKVRYRKRITLKNGVIKSKIITADTPKECMAKMQEYEKTLKEQNIANSRKTLEQGMKEWLILTKKPVLKPQSYQRLEQVINNQIGKYDIGKLRYYDISSKEIQLHINYLNEEKHYSKSTIKKVYDALNDFYRYSAAEDNIDNPMLRVNMPITSNIITEDREIEFFDEEDIELFIEEATSYFNTGTIKYRYGNVISANIYMGLRAGELLALKWGDVDFDKKTVYVCKTMIQITNPEYDPTQPYLMKDRGISKIKFVVQKSTKRNKNRYVPLNDKAIFLLKKQKELSYHTESDDFIITTQRGKSCNIHNLTGTIHTIEKNAETKVQNSGTHVLRHTCASLYFRNNVPIEIICKILGNTREVCETTYVHFVEEQLKDEANKIAVSYI